MDFAEGCDSSATGVCHWELSWGAKGSVKPERTDDKIALLFKGPQENSVRFVEQKSEKVWLDEHQIVTLSALIKTKEVVGKGAGINIGLYDSIGALLATRDLGGFYSIAWVSGDHNWEKRQISLVCPKKTRFIKIGMILFGKGNAWFKDLKTSVELIQNRVPGSFAKKYISSACTIISKHSLVRDSIDISTLRQTALKMAGGALKASDCYLAVEFLLESLRPLGDIHSFFMTADEHRNWKMGGSKVQKVAFPTVRKKGDFGFIVVPPFHGGNQRLIESFADSLQMGIRYLSTKGVKGWVVDLRQNTGGNMEPMIAGLGPLFSSEKLGSLVDVEENGDAWYYKSGRYFGDHYKGWKVRNPVHLPEPGPIAVLTSGQTGSSGEIVAISFIGNARTRSFGSPTWGLTTGNRSFELPDGARIFLAATIMADRSNRKYDGPIHPDVLVEDNAETAEDEILMEATKWLGEAVGKSGSR